MPNWNKQSRQEGSLKIFAFLGCPTFGGTNSNRLFEGNVRKRERSERNYKSESREAGRADSLAIFAKGSSDFFKKSPPNWILQRVGGGSAGAAEGKDLCEALFELAKKPPEKRKIKWPTQKFMKEIKNCP